MPKPPFPAAGGAMPALGPTTRRSLLAGLAASPIALPIVAEAAIIPALTGPHPDQALIGSSFEYTAIELAIGKLLKEDEDHPDLDRCLDRQREIREQHFNLPAVTAAGVQAKAEVLRKQVGFVRDGQFTGYTDGDEALIWSISNDLRRADGDAMLRQEAPRPVPVAALVPSSGSDDPVYALIAEWRAEGNRLDASTADEDGKHYSDLTDKLYRAVPATIAGLAALAAIFREGAEWNDDAELWLDTICVALGKLTERDNA